MNPAGYRFLVQLVDAETEMDAVMEIFKMYGIRCSMAAKFVAGSERLGKQGSVIALIPQKQGFTVYVPIGFKIG